jgi:hypothetical protein
VRMVQLRMVQLRMVRRYLHLSLNLESQLVA